VVVEFCAPMSPEQQQWLRTTRMRVRRVAFHAGDAASASLLRDQFTLVRALLQSHVNGLGLRLGSSWHHHWVP